MEVSCSTWARFLFIYFVPVSHEISPHIQKHKLSKKKNTQANAFLSVLMSEPRKFQQHSRRDRLIDIQFLVEFLFFSPLEIFPTNIVWISLWPHEKFQCQMQSCFHLAANSKLVCTKKTFSRDIYWLWSRLSHKN